MVGKCWLEKPDKVYQLLRIKLSTLGTNTKT